MTILEALSRKFSVKTPRKVKLGHCRYFAIGYSITKSVMKQSVILRKIWFLKIPKSM